MLNACFLLQILIGELAAFFSKPESPQEKTIVTADCCYFSPMLRRIVRFLGKRFTCWFDKYSLSILMSGVYSLSLFLPPTFSSIHSGIYSFGLFVTTIFANAGQVVTGSQTPHFLSVCRPNYTALGCRSPLQYISEKRACRGNPSIITSARKSFPSKDAALSTYCAVYTAVRHYPQCTTTQTVAIHTYYTFFR